MEFIDDIFYIILSYLNVKNCNILERLNKKIMMKLYDKRNVLIKISSINNFCFFGIIRAIKIYHTLGNKFNMDHLSSSIIKNNYETTKYICENIDIQDDSYIIIALNDACKYGHINIVKYIRHKYLKSYNLCLNYITIFGNACYSGNIKLIKYIYNINRKNDDKKNNFHINNKKKYENWEINFYDISQYNILNTIDLKNSHNNAKNLIDILKIAIINEKYNVIIFLINRYDKCYDMVLLLLCIYKKYNIIKKIIDKYNIFITYLCINEIFKNIGDIKQDNNDDNFIYKYMCSKIKIKKINRCCSHIIKNNKIFRCNNLAYNLNDMCLDHMYSIYIKLNENDIKKIIKCVYCDFNSDKLSRCKQNNIGNGFCSKHSKYIYNFNKYILIQMHMDIAIIKNMMDTFSSKTYNKSVKIKKMIIIFKYTCEYVLLLLNNERLKNTVTNKLIEFIGEVDKDNDRKIFQSYLDFVLLL